MVLNNLLEYMSWILILFDDNNRIKSSQNEWLDQIVFTAYW